MNTCIRCNANLGHEASETPIGTRVVDDGLLCPDCVDRILDAHQPMLDALRRLVRETVGGEYEQHLDELPGLFLTDAVTEAHAAIALAERLEGTA